MQHVSSNISQCLKMSIHPNPSRVSSYWQSFPAIHPLSNLISFTTRSTPHTHCNFQNINLKTVNVSQWRVDKVGLLPKTQETFYLDSLSACSRPSPTAPPPHPCTSVGQIKLDAALHHPQSVSSARNTLLSPNWPADSSPPFPMDLAWYLTFPAH